MARNLILDSTILLHDPHAVMSFADSNVVIPIEVIEEIDAYKRDSDERGRNSRTAARILDELRSRGTLGRGVPLDHGGTLRVACDLAVPEEPVTPHTAVRRVNDRILALALHLRDACPDDETVVLTKNVNLRLKADALGVLARDYDLDRSPEADEYTGWFRREAAAQAVSDLGGAQPVTLPGTPGLPNEYVLLVSETDDQASALGRVTGESPPQRVVPIEHSRDDAVGIRPLNLEQTFALDALLNDDIKLVTLSGKAGTGKTLLAVAAGLRKIFQEDRYNRLLVFRPIMPVGKDIGFLPGDVNEKMQPWMQPVCDALELVREQDRRSPKRALPPDIMDCEEISIEPLTYIRGRSIPHQFIIIDEAQNLTPLEVKTVITRVGQDTKIVLTGDTGQIDNPFVDALSNGLTFLVGHFRANALAAHVGLRKGERSALAETAANLL